MPRLEDQDVRGEHDFRRSLEFTFRNGGIVQNGYFDLEASCETIVGIMMPAAWTAANLTVMAIAPDGDPDADTWLNVYEVDGTEYTVTVGAGQLVVIPVGDLAGLRYLRFRSGTAGTPVAQGARRVLRVVTRPV